MPEATVTTDPPNGLPSAVDVAPTNDDADRRARQRAVLLAFGRRVVSRPSVNVLMQDAVSLIAETIEVDLSGVVELNEPQGMLRLSLFSVEQPEQDHPTLEYGRDPGTSLIGHAIDGSLPVVCANLSEETRFKDRQLAGLGVVSAIAVPLYLHRQSYGALVLMCRSERHFSPDDALFVETIGHLLSVTIARVRAEASLQEARQTEDSVLDTIHACVLLLDRHGRIRRVNRTCREWGEYSLDELVGRPFWNVFVLPTELEMMQATFRRILAGETPPSFSSWLKPKNGKERRIAWNVSVRHQPSGELDGIVLAGLDITSQVRAERRAKEAENITSRLQEELETLRQTSDTSQRLEQGQAHPPFAKIPTAPIDKEQRKSPRRAFPYMQRVAPLVDGKTPPRDAFREVPFRDISSSGASFLMTERPTVESFVVQLGQEPHVTHLVARVARVESIESEGRTAYLIGCQFTGRM